MLISGFEKTYECFESMLVKLANSWLKVALKQPRTLRTDACQVSWFKFENGLWMT